MRVTLNFTRPLLAKATPGAVHGCALYRALKPHLKRGVNLWVERHYIALGGLDVAATVVLPRRLAYYALHFDRGEKVEPDRFKLNVPARYLSARTVARLKRQAVKQR